eukprot:2532002-Amphidinium_carterae.3
MASDILLYVLRELVPSAAHARVCMTEEIQTAPRLLTTSLAAFADFMKSWLTNSADCGMTIGSQFGAHEVLAVLKHASQEVC